MDGGQEWARGLGVNGQASGRKGAPGSDSFPPTFSLQTWRQLWRVLEMSDIVLLITDVRHPVSTGMRWAGGRREEDLLGPGQRQKLETGILLPLQAPALC